MARLEKDYFFEGPEGPVTLLDLFEGRRQLIVYHFMFGPNQDAGCDGCAMFADQVCHLAHLHARDYFTSGRVPRRSDLSDLTPLDRYEDWEDSPPDRPQGPPYEWWRRHDEYAEGDSV